MVVFNEIADREAFMNILESNEGVVILKFGADWCQPCKLISPYVKELTEKLPHNITLYDLDVDDNFEIFAFMKSKKMVSGIPALLAYYRENKTFASNDSISGANQDEIKSFFTRCVTQSISYR